MKKVFKYTLQPYRDQTIPFGKHDQILSVTAQKNQIVLYALVDQAPAKTKPVTIRIYATGQEIDEVDGFNFLGTVSLQDGELMFHVFYKE